MKSVLSGHRPGVHLYLDASSIDGRGLFAARRIPARRKIGELTGELITQDEARRRARGGRRIAIVELRDGHALDAGRAANWFRYVNHSCAANAYIRIYARHVEFYARRTIRAGEEITCDYGESHHEGRLRCRCGSPRCRGFI
jgi:SET domain-containing protein